MAFPVLNIASEPPPAGMRYGVALIAMLVILALRFAVVPYIGSDGILLAMFLAVLTAAWYGGIGPGIAVTFLSVLLVRFVPSVAPISSLSGLLFLLPGIAMSYFIDQAHRSHRELQTMKNQIEEMAADLESRIEERTAQFNDTIRELEAFSYSVSHDLRAPLRAIDGFSRMLQEDYDARLDDEGRRILNIIRSNTVNMGNLIDGLLAFSRLGRQAMAQQTIDMTELAEEAGREVLGEAPPPNLEFTVKPLPSATGDRILLRQVFINLISNAVKFSRGRAHATVEVGGSEDGSRQTFYVKDNGVGFDARYADKMFGVFQRLHAATEFEGTGLGLAIVQRIVSRHGGHVRAEGAVDRGATVSFTLPAP